MSADRIRMDNIAVHDDLFFCDTMRDTIGMQSFGRIVNIANLVLQCQCVPGDMVEFGCYRGGTAALISCLTTKKLWLYDSFQGNPKPSPEDNIGPDAPAHHQEGGNKTTFKDLCSNLAIRHDGHDGFKIVAKFFEDLTDDDIPPRISFAHFDCNFYSGTKACLRLALPHMMPGAVGVIDDYGHPELPGVKAAVAEVGLHHLWNVMEPGGERSSQVYFINPLR